MINNINIDYILEYIGKLDAGTMSAEDLINELCLKLRGDYNISDTPELRQTLMNIIASYQNKAISSDFFMTLLKEVIITNAEIQPEEEEASYEGGGYSGGGGGSRESSSNVVEIIPDVVIEIAGKLEELENSLDSAEIPIPSMPSGTGLTKSADITNAVNTTKTEIKGKLTNIRLKLVEVLNNVTSLDDDIDVSTISDITYDKIKEHAEKTREYRLQEVEKEFFENNGCTIDGNYAILTVDGKECKYNLKTHKFYVDGKESMEARIYAPGGSGLAAEKLKTLDTYTCFTAGGNSTNNRESQSIVIEIKRQGDKYTKYEETAYLTKFINQVAKTDRNVARADGTKPKNIIGGDSVYGTHSLKIAAETGNVYDTVYCINSPVIVTGENGRSGDRTQFASLDDLKKLDGKEIYMIYTSGDDNFTYTFGNNRTSYEKGYTYTGLNLLKDNCPNSQVYVVYNAETNADNHEVLIGLLQGLDGGNFHYSPELWDYFANERYSSHHGGTELIIDSVKATGSGMPGNRA